MIVTRTWGTYEVLAEGSNWKLKRLLINPKSKSSVQRHFHRSEVWFYPDSTAWNVVWLGMWHQLVNESDKVLEIIELQFGTECNEEDIERKEENT